MGFSDNFEIKEGTGWKAAISAAPALLAGYQAINAGIKYGKKKTQVETLLNERQQLDNPFANVQNPYENLSVATQAAKFQAEQADISLANTLDTLRQTGAAAGGATALAQAALKSKQGISADIEKQEVNNEKLRAQGQLQVDLAKGKGEYMRMMAQEQRDIGDINFAQAQADQLKAQQVASEQSAMSALGDVGDVITKGIVPKKKDGSEIEADTTEFSLSNNNNNQASTQRVTNEQLQAAEDAQRKLRQERAIQDRQIDQTINPNNKPLGSGFNNPSYAQTPVKRSLQYMIDNPNEFNAMAAMRGEYGVELQNHYRPTLSSSVTGIK